MLLFQLCNTARSISFRFRIRYSPLHTCTYELVPTMRHYLLPTDQLPLPSILRMPSSLTVLKTLVSIGNKLLLFFFYRYPHIVEREERLWAARYERLKESLEGDSSPPSTPTASPKKKDRRKRSTTSEEDPPKPKQNQPHSKSNSQSKPPSKTKKQHSESPKVNGLVCTAPAIKKEPIDESFQNSLSPNLTADCS